MTKIFFPVTLPRIVLPAYLLAGAAVAVIFAGCSGSHLVVKQGQGMELCQCPPLPMCVSSDSWVPYNRVAPFVLAVPAERAWGAVREEVEALPRTEIVEERPGYIHAKCSSLVFRFTDNLEFLLQADKGIISVRSASSIALFDLGVNHLRIYGLRKGLRQKGFIR